MKSEELRAIQAPLKERYKETPQAAVITLRAQGRLGEGVTCNVQTGKDLVAAGLHPATGGDGLSACSGDMLLEALVACAGVTLRAVATALGIEVRAGVVRAEGDLDFRGTLGVAKDFTLSFVEPVLMVLDAILPLNVDVGGVRRRNYFGGCPCSVVNVHVNWHR